MRATYICHRNVLECPPFPMLSLESQGATSAEASSGDSAIKACAAAGVRVLLLVKGRLGEGFWQEAGIDLPSFGEMVMDGVLCSRSIGRILSSTLVQAEEDIAGGPLLGDGSVFSLLKPAFPHDCHVIHYFQQLKFIGLRQTLGRV